MTLNPIIRKALLDWDVPTYRKAARAAMPHVDPTPDHQIEMEMHIARTAAQSIPQDKRLYSHSWLRERNIPSMLPDRLLPLADRLYPTVVEGVFSLVGSGYGAVVAHPIAAAMGNKVEEMYADGDTAPALVLQEKQRARFKERNGLMLRKMHVHDDVPMAWRP